MPLRPLAMAAARDVGADEVALDDHAVGSREGGCRCQPETADVGGLAASRRRRW